MTNISPSPFRVNDAFYKDSAHPWPAVMEAAFLYLAKDDTDSAHYLNGGGPSVALSVIYGKSASCWEVGKGFDASALKKASKTPMIACTADAAKSKLP